MTVETSKTAMLVLAVVLAAPGLARAGEWQVQDLSEGPSARTGFALAYDTAGDRVVLVGGHVPGPGPMSDVWALDADGWHELAIEGAPPARWNHAIVFDGMRVLAFGGEHEDESGKTVLGDAWTLTDDWSEVGGEGPGPRARHALAYDANRDRVVLFGGVANGPSNAVGDTWEWDPQRGVWIAIEVDGPPPRRDHAMAFDGERVIVFGGLADGYLGDTWAFDGRAWQLLADDGPAPRSGHAMAGIGDGRIALFGGVNEAATQSDTWIFDGSSWTKDTTAGDSIPGRFGHRMVARAGDVVLFGGHTPALDASTWVYVPDATPGPDPVDPDSDTGDAGDDGPVDPTRGETTTSDAGSETDATDGGSASEGGDGCGCRGGSPSSPMRVLGVLALLLFVRRRIRSPIMLAIAATAAGCATPCKDDGLLQGGCPDTPAGGATDTDGPGSADASASMSMSATTPTSASATMDGSASMTADSSSSISDTADSSDGVPADDGCGAELHQSVPVPASVLIVLDRSGSMNETIPGGTKWDVGRAAIDQFLVDFGQDARFGLMLFPGFDLPCDTGMACGPGTVFIEIGDATAPEIADALQQAQTCSFGTPIAETLQTLNEYRPLADPRRANAIILITDGAATCADPVPVVQALHDADPEILTYVIGFGDGVDADQLAAMAQSGGTATMNDPVYYQADDAGSLGDALAEIGASVLSCVYALTQVPDSPDDLFVFFDGLPVPRDPAHVEGWDYDDGAQTLTFFGSACDALQSGEVIDLQIVGACE